MRETWIRSLSWEDPLEKGKATHSSILAWRIPRTFTVHGVAKSWIRQSNLHFHFLLVKWNDPIGSETTSEDFSYLGGSLPSP